MTFCEQKKLFFFPDGNNRNLCHAEQRPNANCFYWLLAISLFSQLTAIFKKQKKLE